MFDAIVASLEDTRIEPDLAQLLWGITNVFHRAVDEIERELDDNEAAQKRSQREQDGSEIRSVELVRPLREGGTMIERRDTMEFLRDAWVNQLCLHIGNPWSPRAGSHVNHRALTAAMIDSRDFRAAKTRADGDLLMPAGTRIALTGGVGYQDHRKIWAILDRTRAKFPDMILMHGGTPTGADHIAACWARDVTTILFRPDWAKHGKAAPFKRNDRMLEQLPAGLIAFPGNGISANLADKARRMGISVWRQS